MITLLEGASPLWEAIPPENPMGAKLLTLSEVYGFDRPFLQCYVQTVEGNPFGWLIHMDGEVAVLSLEGNPLVNELCAFIEMLPEAHAVLVKGSFPTEILRRYSTGEFIKLPYKLNKEIALPPGYSLCEPTAEEAYRVFSVSEGVSENPLNREAFIADCIYRKRVNKMMILGAKDRDGKVCAAAVTSAQTLKIAVIGGIAVAPLSRGRRLGAALLKAMVGKLQSMKLIAYVYCAETGPRDFYLSTLF